MTATSVVPPPMSTIMLPVGSCTGRPGADGGGHGLLDDVGGLAGAGVLGGLLHGALLDAGDARRDADDHARLDPAAVVHLLDEVAEHLLADLEVGDDAVLQRPDGLDVRRACGRSSAWPRRRRRAGRPSRTLTATTDGSLSTMPRPADVDDGVGGAEVDRHVAAHDRREHVLGHRAGPPLSWHRACGAAYSCRSEAEGRPQGRPSASCWSAEPRGRNRTRNNRAADGSQALSGRGTRARSPGRRSRGRRCAWTRFSVVIVAKSPRIVPGSASSTLVAPMSLRTSEKVLSAGPSTTMAKTGERVRKSTSSPKNGLSACSA